MRLRKYEEVTVELNLEERNAWWGDRRQASPQDGLTYGVESGYLRHLYVLEHRMEGLHEASRQRRSCEGLMIE